MIGKRFTDLTVYTEVLAEAGAESNGARAQLDGRPP